MKTFMFPENDMVRDVNMIRNPTSTSFVPKTAEMFRASIRYKYIQCQAYDVCLRLARLFFTSEITN